MAFNPDKDIPNLSGKVILVTGGTSGLGLETVRQLVKHNPARLYVAGRSKTKLQATLKCVQNFQTDKVRVLPLMLDLASFESVKAAVRKFEHLESEYAGSKDATPHLDTLVNNAGVMMTAEGLTEDGYELQFGTNFMGHALLTQLLLPTLRMAANPRIVWVSSAMEKLAPDNIYDFDELKTNMENRNTIIRYAFSKMASIYYAAAMADVYTGVESVVIEPGKVATNLHQNASNFALKLALTVLGWFIAVPTEKGVLNHLWATVSTDVKSGMFYVPVGVLVTGSSLSRDKETRDRFWNWTQKELRSHFN